MFTKQMGMTVLFSVLAVVAVKYLATKAKPGQTWI